MELLLFTQTTFPVAEANAAIGPRFRVGELIRGGGQGVVYRASRTYTREGKAAADDCAVKYYFDSAQDQRIDREIRALEGFRHPNLANVLEHGRFDINNETVRFIVWEYIDG